MNVSDIFDRHARNYDGERERLIPGFHDFYGVAVDVLTFEGDNPKVLDLGAGTGLLTEFLLKKYPNAEVELIDLADNMLDVARERFKDNPNISYRNENYLTAEFDGEYDIIMSSLSIHHLTQEEKGFLYEKYVNLLNDGGIFINADLVCDEDDSVERLFYKKVDDLILQNVSLEEFEQANERRKFDDTDSIQYQLDCLKESGCNMVGVPFKFYTHAVLWGQK
ncbi:MAG: class I SAM-dependent methyltransferase [Methanobrevibacter sp.]|uniref:class I SAM-dependent methyltransferase n=1 Tax=Methanobrevibacter sp. TaxID=66852 RepID=UPI0026E1006F|nr:class I SAM-dependent methyltransferase [Methanobrevibacter sp.]MDO5848951.1 class I SAM-dependent methyltransferase [Methanobrevibacter sp.]